MVNSCVINRVLPHGDKAPAGAGDTSPAPPPTDDEPLEPPGASEARMLRSSPSSSEKSLRQDGPTGVTLGGKIASPRVTRAAQS